VGGDEGDDTVGHQLLQLGLAAQPMGKSHLSRLHVRQYYASTAVELYSDFSLPDVCTQVLLRAVADSAALVQSRVAASVCCF